MDSTTSHVLLQWPKQIAAFTDVLDVFGRTVRSPSWIACDHFVTASFCDMLHCQYDMLHCQYDMLHCKYDMLHSQYDMLHSHYDMLHCQYDIAIHL